MFPAFALRATAGRHVSYSSAPPPSFQIRQRVVKQKEEYPKQSTDSEACRFIIREQVQVKYSPYSAPEKYDCGSHKYGIENGMFVAHGI